MSTYVALLRGINLGGHNRINMGRLRELLADLGHADVQTYVQSGNVVFQSSGRSAAKVANGIEGAIARELGLDVRVLVRTAKELSGIVAANPFVAGGSDVSVLHAVFLADRPAAALVKALPPTFGAPDEFRVAGREVYLRCPNGYGRTKLNNSLFEKRLGVAATTRNWKTVTTLADLAAP